MIYYPKKPGISLEHKRFGVASTLKKISIYFTDCLYYSELGLRLEFQGEFLLFGKPVFKTYTSQWDYKNYSIYNLKAGNRLAFLQVGTYPLDDRTLWEKDL